VLGSQPVLPYLLRTPERIAAAALAANLTEAERALLVTLVEREAAAYQAARQHTEPIVRDPRRSREEKQAQIVALGYNAEVETAITTTDRALRDGLAPAHYAALRDWVEATWRLEQAQATAPPSRTPNGFLTLRVYATWFDPAPGDPLDEVALPDKYLKFANRGWRSAIPVSGYEGNDYRVTVSYRGRVAAALKVWDVGPWNVDDTYWSSGPSDPQPRRLFTDLPPGLPEAQAAFFMGYNDGKDQFGRRVTVPTALDIGPAVRDALAFSGSDWVDLTLLWRLASPSYPPVLFLPLGRKG
jgi:hypothetical protein